MDKGNLERALEALGALLEDRESGHELFVIGGGSLLLTGFIERPTEDIDVVALADRDGLRSARPLPDDLVAAVVDVAGLFGLAANWLNAGPTDSLKFGLPDGFRGRTTRHVYRTLVIHHASRYDQVCFKLYAAVDTGPRSKHAQDLARLRPTKAELLDAARWTRTHDPSDAFRDQLEQVLAWMDGDGGDDADD